MLSNEHKIILDRSLNWQSFSLILRDNPKIKTFVKNMLTRD